MPPSKKTGRPLTQRGKAETSKAKALALLRWHQLRVLRREYRRVADFEVTLTRALAMVRDRLLGVPDRLDLTPAQRQTLRREIAAEEPESFEDRRGVLERLQILVRYDSRTREAEIEGRFELPGQKNPRNGIGADSQRHAPSACAGAADILRRNATKPRFEPAYC
jgi:hypothetical protein